MKRIVIFPLVYDENGTKIVYPDSTFDVWGKSNIEGNSIVAEYSGNLILDIYKAPEIPYVDLTIPSDFVDVGVDFIIPFTTNLSDGNYPVTIRRDLKNNSANPEYSIEKFVTAGGSGSKTVNFTEKGTYYIDISDLTSELRVNSVLVDRLTLKVW